MDGDLDVAVEPLGLAIDRGKQAAVTLAVERSDAHPPRGLDDDLGWFFQPPNTRAAPISARSDQLVEVAA